MQSNLLDLITIDRRSRIDYGNQLKENIKSLILDQTFYYQTKLPRTKELADHLNIEEKYVMIAYDNLADERYLKKEGELDFIVTYFELTNYFFDRNVAVYDAIIALGLTPSIKCIEKKVVKLSNDKIKEMGFNLEEDNRYFYINRLYLGDNQPIMLLENYLPLYIFKNIDDDFQGFEPLDAYINEHYGLKAQVSKRTIKSVNLPAFIAKILNERKNAASIQSTNQIYDKYHRLIDFGQSHTVSSYYFQALINKEEMNDYFPGILK